MKFHAHLIEHGLVRIAVLTTSVLVLSSCGDPCPQKDGMILCGYCGEDVVTSSNPNAGKCRYCAPGGVCGDPCTMTSCSGQSGSCDQYPINCGAINNGIEVVGGVVPESCPCPSNTYQSGVDNVTAGGPYKICSCN